MASQDDTFDLREKLKQRLEEKKSQKEATLVSRFHAQRTRFFVMRSQLFLVGNE